MNNKGTLEKLEIIEYQRRILYNDRHNKIFSNKIYLKEKSHELKVMILMLQSGMHIHKTRVFLLH